MVACFKAIFKFCTTKKLFAFSAFFVSLARPARINLNSPIDDRFIWPKYFNSLSLIAADTSFSFVWDPRLSIVT